MSEVLLYMYLFLYTIIVHLLLFTGVIFDQEHLYFYSSNEIYYVDHHWSQSPNYEKLGEARGVAFLSVLLCLL